MAQKFSPAPILDNLLLYIDMYNPRSYSGPPITNILPNGQLAGYPTVGSGWGTYNTNQYGSGTYFSIGTVTGVASNIVTCPNHTLRTYDAVQPQTTGGGVTAGTVYLVRKWDANTFSLYAYDSTPDSYTIFSAHNNLNTDNRVALTTGITNMWWGPPHVPNSGVMKQVVKNGFQYKGRVHDCIRVHWYRPDGVTDGMAYGNYATLTAGKTYTVSFYHRAATPNAVGTVVYNEHYCNGEDSGQTFTLGASWQKHTMTWLSNQSGGLNLYWFKSSGPTKCSWDISEIMVYEGPGPAEYIDSGIVKGVSDVFTDLSNSNTVSIVGTPTYNASSITFPNINTAYINANDATKFRMGTQDFTISIWVKQLDNGTNCLVESRGASLVGYLFVINYPSAGKLSLFLNYGGTQYIYSSSIATLGYGTVQNIVAVISRSTSSIIFYVNGVLWNTITGIHASSVSPTSGDIYRIGNDLGGGTQNYELYSHAHYSRALTADEILNNFNAHRGRYGL